MENLERHHFAGRWAPGKGYISPLTVEVTKEMHDRIHVALRAAFLEFPGHTDPAQLDFYLRRRYQLQLQILADQ